MLVMQRVKLKWRDIFFISSSASEKKKMCQIGFDIQNVKQARF